MPSAVPEPDRSTPSRPRVAFVVQRYLAELVGGAEYHCRLYAELLADCCDVTVLTTNCSDHLTWEADLPEGREEISGVEVLRFDVPRPRHPDFGRWWSVWQGRQRTPAEEWQWAQEQGPVAPGLLAHLTLHADDYDVFVFFTYLYHPTMTGVPLVADKVVLVPTVNPGEVESFFTPSWWVFNLPREILYLSVEERAWVQSAAKNQAVPSSLIGIPIPLAQPGAVRIAADRAATLVAAKGVDRPYLLFLGRIGPSKGVDRLLEHYAHYRSQFDDPIDLVLAGSLEMELPRVPGVRHIGAVFGEEKEAVLARCVALVNASRFDCYSIAVHEAWAMSRPVLVDAETPVLLGLTHRSGGGLTFRDAESFAASVDRLVGDAAAADAMGRAGRTYVEHDCDAARIRAHLLSTIHKVMAQPPT